MEAGERLEKLEQEQLLNSKEVNKWKQQLIETKLERK